MSEKRDSIFRLCSISVALGCSLLSVTAVRAQEAGYTVTENTALPPVALPLEYAPTRLGHLSLLRGNVQYRHGDSAAWSKAALNLPLAQGSAIRVAKGGRAEIQFDDGSLLRLGSNGLAVLKTLAYEDAGTFTEVQLVQGLASLRTYRANALLQCDTPYVRFRTVGATKVRVGASTGVEFGVQEGKIRIIGQNNTFVERGAFFRLADAFSQFVQGALPEKDSWDLWNEERDALRLLAEKEYRQQGLPENLVREAGDLNIYGEWRNDTKYGAVWCPRETAAGWQPYTQGSWLTVPQIGRAWVSTEEWGWLPYHYGAWIHADYGWAWVPGPRYQTWSPGVVAFTEIGDHPTWRPLEPQEVQYPSLLALSVRSSVLLPDWATEGGGPVLEENTSVPAPTLVQEINQTTIVNPVISIEVENTTFIRETQPEVSHWYQGGFGYQGGYYPGYHYVYPIDRFPSPPPRPPVVDSGNRPRVPPRPRPIDRPPSRPDRPPVTQPAAPIAEVVPSTPRDTTSDYPGRLGLVRTPVRQTEGPSAPQPATPAPIPSAPPPVTVPARSNELAAVIPQKKPPQPREEMAAQLRQAAAAIAARRESAPPPPQIEKKLEERRAEIKKAEEKKPDDKKPEEKKPAEKKPEIPTPPPPKPKS